jgi:hypothetical protein
MTAAVPCLFAAFLDWLSWYRSVSSIISSPIILWGDVSVRLYYPNKAGGSLGLTPQPDPPLYKEIEGPEH